MKELKYNKRCQFVSINEYHLRDLQTMKVTKRDVVFMQRALANNLLLNLISNMGENEINPHRISSIDATGLYRNFRLCKANAGLPIQIKAS